MVQQTSLLRFSVISTIALAIAWAQTPEPPPGPATIAIRGDIPAPIILKAEDLTAMPREKVTVPEPNGTPVEYEGVPLREILARAGAPMGKLRGKTLTTYVLAKARDGYEVVFTLGEVDTEFGNQQIILADKRNGKPLPADQGPFRLECAKDKAGARSVRMLESLEIVRLRK